MSKEKYEAHRRLIEREREATELPKPFGWIQWKGTSVCMDIHCTCGTHSHIDDEFAYYFKCKCGQRYAVAAVVKLAPVTQAEIDATDIHEGVIKEDAQAMDSEP